MSTGRVCFLCKRWQWLAPWTAPDQANAPSAHGSGDYPPQPSSLYYTQVCQRTRRNTHTSTQEHFTQACPEYVELKPRMDSETTLNMYLKHGRFATSDCDLKRIQLKCFMVCDESESQNGLLLVELTNWSWYDFRIFGLFIFLQQLGLIDKWWILKCQQTSLIESFPRGFLEKSPRASRKGAQRHLLDAPGGSEKFLEGLPERCTQRLPEGFPGRRCYNH